MINGEKGFEIVGELGPLTSVHNPDPAVAVLAASVVEVAIHKL